MKISYSKQALKYISKLDRQSTQRIKNALEQLSKEPPQGDIKPLKGLKNTYRARIGDYRIVFEIDSDRNELILARIGPRGDVYK